MSKGKKTVISLSLFLSLFFFPKCSLAAEDFSKERAYEHLKHLAGTIGPRPLGSPQEKAALTYFAERLAEYGGQVEWQPVTESKTLNTASFNVIGRFPGTTSREIVIGAHIDSSTPEIPGANDDGSGVATMLELARVLGPRVRHSTLVFVAFCGEEAGLVGSKHFVKKYPLQNVVLMLQLDMTSNDSPLMLWIDTKKQQSPEWLVSASIDAFHSLGYRHIDYPTHFQTLNSSLGGAGSDHEPFLEKQIPAIAFVSDVRFPIHTRHDSLAYFKAEGLERSGRLILELVKRFDREIPKKKAGRYMLILVGERPFFIQPYLQVAAIALSLIVASLAFLRLYKKRKTKIIWEEDKKIKKSWPRLAILHFLIVVTTFSSFWIMQVVKGNRIPWYTHPGFYVLYAVLFFSLGIWLALQILKKWKLRRNSFFYFIRASLYLTVLVVFAWVSAGPRLALYPSAGLLLLSLACLVRWVWLKGLLWVLSPLSMFRLLILPEYYEFAYRGMANMGFASVNTFLPSLLATSLLILFVVLWSMPFLLGFAAAQRSHPGDLLALKRFRSLFSLIPIGSLIVGGAVYLRTLPSFTSLWEQQISVVQKFDSQKNETFIEWGSSDYLRGITANVDGQKEMINVRSCKKRIDFSFDLNWLKEKISSQNEEKGVENLKDLRFLLEFEKQPYTVSLKLESNKPFRIEEANVKYRHRKNRATINWFSFPQGSLKPELKVRLPKGARLEAEIAASFRETPLSISCQGKNKHFIYRAEITRKIDLLKQ